MDEPLTVAEPPVVQRRIAQAWLSAPAVGGALGAVTLAPHQTEAAARLLEIIDDFGGALLADEIGMGKTYTALAVAQHYASFRVVAPGALREMWTAALSRSGAAGDITSYELLSRGVERWGGGGAALVIVDEAHHVRNPRTRRYDRLARLTLGSRVLLLSATPVHNRPRELRSQLALFLGARAYTLGDDDLARLIVRRGHRSLSGGTRLPAVRPAICLSIPSAPAVLRAIAAIPPPVPPADGGVASALLRLGLLRLWSSSTSALHEALRARLLRAAALQHAIEAGRFPTRRELAAWAVLDDSLQLAFPELVAEIRATPRREALLRALDAHRAGVRRALDALVHGPDTDAARVAHLCQVRQRHQGERVVVFTQFARTARAIFNRLQGDGAVALVTADGARIASGTISRSAVVRCFDPVTGQTSDPRLPLTMLISTDVLSEGLNLQGANVLVHLDLPWTPARLNQRLGRLRRIGATRDTVYVYAIGPPTMARELSAVIRALQRKTRVLRALIADSDLVAHEPMLPRQPPRRAMSHDDDLVHFTEALRDTMRPWLARQLHWKTDTGIDDRRPVMAAVFGRSVKTWRALALMRTGRRCHLVAFGPGTCSTHPRDLLDVARAVDQSRPIDLPSAAPRDAREAIVHEASCSARRAAENWLADSRGTVLAAPAVDMPSPEHVRALRLVGALAAGGARHERPHLSDLASRCRTALLRARGAGVERLIADWIGSGNASTTEPQASTRLPDLLVVLGSRNELVPDSPPGAALEAILVVVAEP